MPDASLRQRKRSATRRHIADTAARLFGERGFENVTVSEVARAADVAEQTVYNHFRSKDKLVTDRDEEVQARLCQLIGDRDGATSPAAAIRGYVLESVNGFRDVPPDIWQGEIGHLAARSPAVRRLVLETLATQADAMAAAIAESSAIAPDLARLQASAISGVYRILIDEAGSRTRDGQSQERIADDLYPLIELLLDELDRWFSS